MYAHDVSGMAAHLLQESEGPFPWQSAAAMPATGRATLQRSALRPPPMDQNSSLQDDKHLRLTAAADAHRHGLHEAMEDARSMAIVFDLPKFFSCTAGVALRHAVAVVDRLFQLHYPMTFKLGYTHSPSWRWSNPIYGYSMSIEKWEQMVVLYSSFEPYGAAMLEAALIEKYHRDLEALDRYC